MSDCTQCTDYEWCAKNEECGMFKQKQMTKADQIRNMSDEELCNEYFRILNHVLGRYTDSRAGLLEWLKQPAE